MRIAITGANRGIGLELVRQCLARGDEVVAAVRDVAGATALKALEADAGGRLLVLPCDVSDDASVRAFAARVPAPVDCLINNAGVGGGWAGVEQLSFQKMLEVYSINALGPLRVTVALLPQLRASGVKKVLHLTSGLGSIGDNTSGGSYAYRMSKAALNMASRSLAVDLRGEGILSAVINPGWVRTDMGGANAPTPVEESAAGILARLDALAPEQSGAYLDYREGKTWPW